MLYLCEQFYLHDLMTPLIYCLPRQKEFLSNPFILFTYNLSTPPYITKYSNSNISHVGVASYQVLLDFNPDL